ncbi:MAG: murein L,D-transpeptidase [bacterium]
MTDLLHELIPQFPLYDKLVKSLADYRFLARQGGWDTLPVDLQLRPGDTGARVRELKDRLAREQYWPPETPEKVSRNEFGKQLKDVLERYQVDRGLKADGKLGKQTVSELNVPVEDRIRRIILNMERMRWLPEELGSRYVYVNIANYEVAYIENGLRKFSSRAIVGRPYRQTPVFADHISHLVFNPRWYIPSSIVKQDIIPRVLKDTSYLNSERIKLYSREDTRNQFVDPSTVNWSQLDPDRFSYQMVQEPGPWNELGKVKFMFPNHYNVYLHDTPEKKLFSRTVRNFSSGCIRVEKALELASEITRLKAKTIRDIVSGGDERTYFLRKKIPVYILYLTAWRRGGERIQFRSDIYHRDRELLRKYFP